MKEPIVLSLAEHQAAVAALRHFFGTKGDPAFGFAVNDFIEAVNRVRAGDPVGTVRVNGTSTAVRRPYGWLLIHPDHCDERNDERSPVDVSDWKVVHTP